MPASHCFMVEHVNKINIAEFVARCTGGESERRVRQWFFFCFFFCFFFAEPPPCSRRRPPALAREPGLRSSKAILLLAAGWLGGARGPH